MVSKNLSWKVQLSLLSLRMSILLRDFHPQTPLQEGPKVKGTRLTSIELAKELSSLTLSVCAKGYSIVGIATRFLSLKTYGSKVIAKNILERTY